MINRGLASPLIFPHKVTPPPPWAFPSEAVGLFVTCSQVYQLVTARCYAISRQEERAISITKEAEVVSERIVIDPSPIRCPRVRQVSNRSVLCGW